MSTKNPRGSRKPLDQSFLEFVHGTEPRTPEVSQPEAAPSEDAHRLSQVEAELTQLKQQVEQMDQNRNQPLTELKQRLDQLEKTLLDRESRYFSQVDSQLTCLTQQVERLETYFRKALAELQFRPPKPEEPVPSQDINNHGSLTETHLTQPIQSVLEVESNHSPPPEPIDKASERRVESDSLLSHMGPLLDNF